MPQLKNLRLFELVKIVRLNKAFYLDFLEYLKSAGYTDIKSFMQEKSQDKALKVVKDYLSSPIKVKLYDGVANPYQEDKAKWYFLTWVMRDAPAQRLAPMLKGLPGRTLNEKKTFLINEIRKFVAPLFPDSENWEWAAISEVMLARLEGSRRSLKGNLFEGIIRRLLEITFKENGLHLDIFPKQVTISGETYDVQIVGAKTKILIPVKTRETMGGGHAMLFTRDISKAIEVAIKNGYVCIPIIIAESWSGDLSSLGCENYISIRLNPNEIEKIEPILAKEFTKLVPIFRKLQ